jgi:L-malate glycosyltransferase
MDVKPRKIAIICNYELLPTRVGGMDYFFWLFDKKCKENNVEVDWFFPNKATHGDYLRLNIIESNYNNVEHFFTQFITKKKCHYTHIITHFVEVCSPIFKKMKAISNSKIIVVDHNPRPINGYSLKKRIEKRVKGILYSRYIDIFIGVSNYSKNQLIKEFGFQISKKANVIFNGLDIKKFKQKVSFNSNTNFVIASHLRKDKGVQDVIEVVKQIKVEISISFTITIFGEGYYEAELKRKINEAALQEYFVFKGSVSNLHELYCNYDYLIHPSHGETFCYTVVESLLSNLPVITNNQGNILGLISNNSNGFLYKDHQINDLKDIIKRVLKEEIKIENGLLKDPKVTNLSLDKMVASYFQIIN